MKQSQNIFVQCLDFVETLFWIALWIGAIVFAAGLSWAYYLGVTAAAWKFLTG